jgi:hypothetical protein
MTTATFIKKPKRLRRLSEGPLGVHIDLFSARLSKEGHSQQSAWRNLKVVGDFSRWLARKGIFTEGIDEDIVDQYMRFRARHRHTFIWDRPALNRLLAVLREVELIAPKRLASVSPQERIVDDFRCHLSQCGGYASRTIITHLPTLRRFLSQCCPDGTSSFRKLLASDVNGVRGPASSRTECSIHSARVLDAANVSPVSTVQGFNRCRPVRFSAVGKNLAIQLRAAVSPV